MQKMLLGVSKKRKVTTTQQKSITASGSNFNTLTSSIPAGTTCAISFREFESTSTITTTAPLNKSISYPSGGPSDNEWVPMHVYINGILLYNGYGDFMLGDVNIRYIITYNQEIVNEIEG